MKNTINKLIAALFIFGASVATHAQSAYDTQVYQQDGANQQYAYYIPHNPNLNQIEIWHSGNKDIESRDFSLSTITTNSSGDATVTFPATFAATPKVFATVIDNTSGVVYVSKVTAKSTGSVTIHVDRTQTILGILSFTSAASGVSVDVFCFVAP